MLNVQTIINTFLNILSIKISLKIINNGSENYLLSGRRWTGLRGRLVVGPIKDSFVFGFGDRVDSRSFRHGLTTEFIDDDASIGLRRQPIGVQKRQTLLAMQMMEIIDGRSKVVDEATGILNRRHHGGSGASGRCRRRRGGGGGGRFIGIAFEGSRVDNSRTSLGDWRTNIQIGQTERFAHRPRNLFATPFALQTRNCFANLPAHSFKFVVLGEDASGGQADADQ